MTLQYKEVKTFDDLHLLGGLRAHTLKDHLAIEPTIEGKVVSFKSITDTRNYYRVIRSLGLDFIGHEQFHENGKLFQPVWYLFEPGKKRVEDVENIWAGIAHTSRKMNEIGIAELAEYIVFSLRISSFRLRDISREYEWQNRFAVEKQLPQDGKYSNIKSFDLDMALHAFLVDMGTARDYLARFISVFLLKERRPVDAMPKLYERVKKGGTTKLDGKCQVVVDAVLSACDRDQNDSWMAKLGEFRNIIVHRSPLGDLAENEFLIARHLPFQSHVFFSIYLGVPRDPFLSSSSEYVDALSYFRELLLKLRGFAKLVADASGVAPTIPTITDADLLK
jgi:hypothetical protein